MDGWMDGLVAGWLDEWNYVYTNNTTPIDSLSLLLIVARSGLLKRDRYRMIGIIEVLYSLYGSKFVNFFLLCWFGLEFGLENMSLKELYFISFKSNIRIREIYKLCVFRSRFIYF